MDSTGVRTPDMTNDGLNPLAYDAENRVVSSDGTLSSGTNSYDGKGPRVKKLAGGILDANGFFSTDRSNTSSVIY